MDNIKIYINVIGYQYGGSGQNFNVPDLRGEFIRGYDDNKGVDSGRGFATVPTTSIPNSYS